MRLLCGYSMGALCKVRRIRRMSAQGCSPDRRALYSTRCVVQPRLGAAQTNEPCMLHGKERGVHARGVHPPEGPGLYDAPHRGLYALTRPEWCAPKGLYGALTRPASCTPPRPIWCLHGAPHQNEGCIHEGCTPDRRTSPLWCTPPGLYGALMRPACTPPRSVWCTDGACMVHPTKTREGCTPAGRALVWCTHERDAPQKDQQ